MSSQSTPRGHDSSGVESIGRTVGRYLLAIHQLSNPETERVTSSELRDSLDVSAASVTEMTAKLDNYGLVEYEKYQGVTLTEQGEDLARQLAWRFCVVTNFFGSVLDADLDTETSYDIGFTLPRDGLAQLRERIDHPCIDACPETPQEYPGCKWHNPQHERNRVNI